eukprot:m.156107 g.156107  ORF g.156107 m.156107 type:complete len:355 (-) comp16288_c0_seq2:205-1269(-)
MSAHLNGQVDRDRRRSVQAGSTTFVPHLGAEVLLYFHPTMQEVAERVGEHVLSLQQASSCQIKRLDVRDDIIWDRFKDGFPNLFIKRAEDIKSRDVIFLANFYPSQLIFEQLAVLYMLPRYMAKSLTIVLPYFPTATMERIDDEGQIPTAVTLAHMLSAVPLTRSGPPQVIVYDIHTLQERFYFSDTVVPRLESAIPLLQQRIQEQFVPSDVVIVFPDEGAHKRFSKRLKSYSCLACSKRREGDKRIVFLPDEDDLKDKDVVIVDDLVQTGGTLRSCASVLRGRGARTVSAFVTHAVFPEQSWKKIAETNDFDHFWFTDTCPESARELDGVKPFELLSIAPHLAGLFCSYDLLV